jgi:hypothetical protein
MKITLEQLKEKQRKVIIKKVIYLNKKFKKIRKYFLTITFKDFEQFIKFDLYDRKKMFDNLVKRYGMKAGFLVVEAQRRGVPHIHMIVWMPKRIFLDKQFSGLYNIGMTNIKKIRNKQVIYYLLKYCLKEQERDIIKYRRKQRFITFYYKGKRKDKQWILLSLTGVNKILREYEIKKNRIAGYTYVNINGSVIKYKIYTSFKEDGLLIRDVWLYDFMENKEYWLLDFRDYIEFLDWFECLILVKLNLN